MNINGEKDNVAKKEVQQDPHVLSGLEECLHTPTKVIAWLGILRMKDGSPNVSIGSAGSSVKLLKGRKR